MDQPAQVKRVSAAERAPGERASDAGHMPKADRTADRRASGIRGWFQPRAKYRPSNGSDAARDTPAPKKGGDANPASDPETDDQTVTLPKLSSLPPEARNGAVAAEAAVAADPETGPQTVVLPKLSGRQIGRAHV